MFGLCRISTLQCRDIGGKDDVNKIVEPQTGIECEFEADRGDLLIKGFWDRSTDCIIDVRIYDANQPSHSTRKPVSIRKYAENEKKNKYLEPCVE